jgi:PhnB protein
VRYAAKAIDFYKKAFNAEVRFRMHGPDGRTIMHADLKIGDSIFMLTEESEIKALSPESIGGSLVSLYVYVKDVDAVFNHAVSEGATVLYPVRDQFYGDRFGYLRDPFGYLWSLATHKKDLSLDEIKKAGEAYFEEMSKTKTGMR